MLPLSQTPALKGRFLTEPEEEERGGKKGGGRRREGEEEKRKGKRKGEFCRYIMHQNEVDDPTS